MISTRFWLTSAATLGFATVALGAFGAHALRGLVEETQLANWRTATDYLGLHALAIFACGLWLLHRPDERWVRWGASALLIGVSVFSGSLFALVLTGQRTLGMITPIGGVLLLIGWGMLVVAAARLRDPAKTP